MSVDEVRVEETRSWLSKSRNDIRAARHDLVAEPPLLSDALFHCQQAVEKALKGFLAWHDEPFRKTHNLVELGEACARIDPSLEPLLRSAAPLTEYAWRFRYPGDLEEPSEEEATQAVALAEEVFNAVEARVPEPARVS